jgi:succinate dehydrogenase / fumarate reductase cytochrome b subunit
MHIIARLFYRRGGYVAKTRPVNLNLFQVRLPVMAISSILHRISGVFLFLTLPYLLWALNTSLVSQVGFTEIQQTFHQPASKCLWILIITAFIYHLAAGLRHLLMDFGYAESRSLGAFTAWVVIAIGLVGGILVGVFLW